MPASANRITDELSAFGILQGGHGRAWTVPNWSGKQAGGTGFLRIGLQLQRAGCGTRRGLWVWVLLARWFASLPDSF
jgi:hypothetical protein